MAAAGDRDDRSAHELFEVVWSVLSEVIGSAATASLIRRSARRAVRAGADLDGLTFERESFEATYQVPRSWQERNSSSVAELRRLTVELRALTAELTGPVLVRRLECQRELRDADLFPMDDPK